MISRFITGQIRSTGTPSWKSCPVVFLLRAASAATPPPSATIVAAAIGNRIDFPPPFLLSCLFRRPKSLVLEGGDGQAEPQKGACHCAIGVQLRQLAAARAVGRQQVAAAGAGLMGGEEIFFFWELQNIPNWKVEIYCWNCICVIVCAVSADIVVYCTKWYTHNCSEQTIENTCQNNKGTIHFFSNTNSLY